MSLTLILIGVSIALIAVVEVSRIVYTAFFSPLSRLPGPFWARLTPLWELKQVQNGLSHRTFVDLHEKYGKF